MPRNCRPATTSTAASPAAIRARRARSDKVVLTEAEVASGRPGAGGDSGKTSMKIWSPATKSQGWVLVALVLLLLAGLPAAVWLDLRTLAESSLRRQTS